MLGLFGTLDAGSQSLSVQEEAMEVTGQNLANVNNAAYSRQQLVIQAATPVSYTHLDVYKRQLYSSATGMESQQLNLDVISNNLANVNTTGFKRSKIEFQDLLYQNTSVAGAEEGNGTELPTGMQVGQGSRAVATAKIFTEGELTQTGERLDIAIQGDGFLQVQMPDGTLAYTRDGSLKTSSDGQITTLSLIHISALRLGGWLAPHRKFHCPKFCNLTRYES